MSRIGKIPVYSSHDNVPTPDNANFVTMYRYSVDDKVYTKNSEGESSAVGVDGTFRQLTAVINQSGAVAPVLSEIIRNDFLFGGNPVEFAFVRSNAGEFRFGCYANPSAPFIEGKVFMKLTGLGNAFSGLSANYFSGFLNIDEYLLKVFSSSNVMADGLITNVLMEFIIFE